MFVKQYGNGKRWAFTIPGWGEDHTCFAPLAKFLPAGFSLAAVDLPGYGQTPRPSKLDIGEVIEQLRAEYKDLLANHSVPETVVGNCSGAVLAAELVRTSAIKPLRLVLVDPFAFVPSYFKLFLKRGYGRRAYDTTFASAIGRWVTNLLLRGRRQRETDLMSAFRDVDHEVNYRYLEIFDSLGSIKRFHTLDMPVTFITGERTFAAVRRSLELWLELWPHANVQRLKGVGHLPIREAPAAVINAICALNGAESSR